MARPKRDKSASVSSVTAPIVNGIMAPPASAPPSSRSSPATTRRKAPSVSKLAPGSSSLPPPKSAHAPAKPSVSKFVLAVVISFFAEAAAQSAASLFLTGELASISKIDALPREVAGHVAWKISLIAVCWFGGLDAVDVASLNTLVQSPIFVLLHYFYLISAPTLIATCTISILSSALPFYALRPLSAPHAQGSGLQRSLRNRIIINDPITTFATAALAMVVYATTLIASFSTFLPVFMVTHFDGLRDLTFAHDTAKSLPTLLFWLAPAGIATTQFLFRPAEGAASSSTTATGANSVALTHNHFDPSTANFLEHVYWNVWGWYTSRQKELIGRTIVLGSLGSLETIVYIWGGLAGIDLTGAAGYASIWLVGTVVLGIALEWVGGPSD